MENESGNLDTLVQEKIDSDADFQATLTDLSDEDKEAVISEKKEEIIKQEFSALFEKAKKAEEIAKNQEIRAKKAEAEAKKPKEKETPKNESSLSLKDLRALQNVHDDDVEKVEKWAKAEGISIAEAVKDPIMQQYFKVRNEERQTANATNVAPARRGASSPTPETILEDFNKGKIPSSDDEIQKLVEARMALKKAQAKGN